MSFSLPKCNVVSVFLFFLATALSSGAQTLSTLASFDDTDGANPYYEALAQGTDGNLYGTTQFGGANGYGTVFRVTPSGALTDLYSFCALPDCADGSIPMSGLVLGTDGDLYGTTFNGGTINQECLGGCGTIFRVDSTGTLATLHRFNSVDGSRPYAALMQATDGNLYGTTTYGGNSRNCWAGCGTVFKVTTSGGLVKLHDFDYADGSAPYSSLVEGTDGSLYGTAAFGGNSNNRDGGGYGIVFKITAAGAVTVLHRFHSDDGANPIPGLTRAASGISFWGATSQGGTSNGGTVFRMTPQGNITTLHSFCSERPNCVDGYVPYAGLTLGSDGNFYGTTAGGGLSSDGTVYEITPPGVFTSVLSFDLFDGSSPFGGVLQYTSGDFYGTTFTGGSEGVGTVFDLSTGLGPFVTFVQAAGRVGQTGGILGQGLTGTTSVSINGVQANFIVISDTYLTATIPPGATTGYVTVTTPTGVLTSNVRFRVIQ